jgi:hypothetical protein
VTRYDEQRLTDIDDAISAIRLHLTRGALSDGLVFDAVRIRLLEIGEAVTRRRSRTSVIGRSTTPPAAHVGNVRACSSRIDRLGGHERCVGSALSNSMSLVA